MTTQNLLREFRQSRKTRKGEKYALPMFLSLQFSRSASPPSPFSPLLPAPQSRLSPIYHIMHKWQYPTVAYLLPRISDHPQEALLPGLSGELPEEGQRRQCETTDSAPKRPCPATGTPAYAQVPHTRGGIPAKLATPV